MRPFLGPRLPRAHWRRQAWFIGAAAMEITGHGDVALSLRVGAGAAQGRLVGIIAKLSFGVVIALMTLIAGFPR